jgi:hypothetical protein
MSAIINTGGIMSEEKKEPIDFLKVIIGSAVLVEGRTSQTRFICIQR